MSNLNYDPATYVPMYAIGQEDDDIGVGFWAGPVPNVSPLFKEFGKDEKSVIMSIDPIVGDKCMYRWNPANQMWVPE
jgi:hypothetical protein